MRAAEEFDVYRWLAQMERALGINDRASLWQAMYPESEKEVKAMEREDPKPDDTPTDDKPEGGGEGSGEGDETKS